MSLASPWLGMGLTVFAWWFSTGLILILVRLPRRIHAFALTGFGVLAIAGSWGVIASANNITPLGIYCGFFCALVIWGWHEASFLMGFITGPRPAPCPPNTKGWKRFVYATATLIYHEIALFLTLIVMGIATFYAQNPMAFWTFGLLFALRLSSKFNIFLGVPNLTDEFFPVHLEHLKSYLPKRKTNVLMPFSILICSFYIYHLWTIWVEMPANSAASLGLVIFITLICLGLLEHLFMITPLPDAALWRWAAPVRKPADPASVASCDPGKSELKKQDNG
jgi:putative photosynthetic complex assembly protein 2